MSKPKAKTATVTVPTPLTSLEVQDRSIFVKRTRNSARHYISPDIAAIGGMDIHQMMGFSMGWYTPSDDQIDALAKRMSLI